MPAENIFRWLMLLASVLALLGLLVFARGVSHHHGQQVGAAGTVLVTATAPG